MDFLSELRASIEAHTCGWTEKVQPHTYTVSILINLVVRRKLWSEEEEKNRLNKKLRKERALG